MREADKPWTLIWRVFPGKLMAARAVTHAGSGNIFLFLEELEHFTHFKKKVGIKLGRESRPKS